jgi:hypothetical protein
LLVALALAAPLRVLFAQGADVIRGRIVGPDSQPLAGATVTVSLIGGESNRTAKTDGTGHFSITFPGNEGDYWVLVTSVGLGPKRFEVKRLADEAVLVANARLTPAAIALPSMEVKASRQRVARDDTVPDVGGSSRSFDPANLTVDQLGSLAAMAASIPGVQFVSGNGGPDGFSVLGLPSDQNITSLDGLIGAGSIPRDAAINARLFTSPFDVSLGGFSGGRFDVQTRPGTNTEVRHLSATLNDPGAEWTDRAGRALGQRYANQSVGGLAAGPIRLNSSFYNLSFQLDRRASDLTNLLDVDDRGLLAAGISPDSVARLGTLLGRANIPAVVGSVPHERVGEQALVLGNLTFNSPLPTSGQSVGLTLSGAWNRQGPLPTSLFEMPAHGASSSNWSGSLQATHSNFLGPVLSESSLGVSGSGSSIDPFLRLPSADVRVASAGADGATALSTLVFGGTAAPLVARTSQVEQATNDLSWFSEDDRHRFKLSTQLRREAFRQDVSANALGTFTFNSLADFERNEPSSFTRTLHSVAATGSQYVGAVALGDFFRPTTAFQLQYGVRIDGHAFSTHPSPNADIERLLGASNATTPVGVDLSPRAGFSWAYGSSREVAASSGAAHTPRAVLRGGVGVFEATPSTAAIGGPLVNTGLALGARQLVCTGAAAPRADWAAYSTTVQSIPTACADGIDGSAFADDSPDIVLFSPGYAPPRSTRATLQWSGPTARNRVLTTLEMTYSRNEAQPGAVDLNFDPTLRSSLGNEAARPLFVDPANVAVETGSIAPTAARRFPQFAHVTELGSGLHGRTAQFSVRLQSALPTTGFGWSLAYVYQNVRDQVSGFSSTAGDPRAISSGRSAFDSRHQIVYNLSANVADVVRLLWYGQFRSGVPYTPMVAGDINGDGYSDDRAFVFDPSRTGDTAVANGLRSLMTRGPSSARECLSRQVGRIADRNSCETPWSALATLTANLNPIKFRLPRRAALALQLTNPLGGMDLALHGENRLHRWGQPARVSDGLLYVRGFDPTSRTFRYTVNEGFGSPDPSRGAFRTPIVLSAIVRVDVGSPRERQGLLRMLDRGRKAPGAVATPDLLRATYAGAGVFNPVAALLRQSDTLRLSVAQADSLAVLNQLYTSRSDSIWLPIARALGALPKDYDESAAYGTYVKGREQTVDLLVSYTRVAADLLKTEQRRRLSPVLAAYLDERFLRSIRSGTLGFGGLNGTPAAPVSAAGGSISAQSR